MRLLFAHDHRFHRGSGGEIYTFSFSGGHATGGDLLAADVVSEWLTALGIDHVIAFAPPFEGGPSLDDIDPREFTHAFFVCGPFGRKPLEADFLKRFAGCRLIGLDLSLDHPPDEWQPFDLLIERDSSRAVKADLVFASRTPQPPVVGVCLVEPHPEADVDAANQAIAALLDRHEAARVSIDTRLDENETGLRTKGEIEALIGRVDVLVTTRLHGLVLALKNGVPVLAVDAVRGRGKISRQCERIGWPNVVALDELDPQRLDDAFAFALSEEARVMARTCGERAAADVQAIRDTLAEQLFGDGELEQRFAQRQTASGRKAFEEAVAAASPRLLDASASSVRKLLRRLLRAR